ncbi:hypothetical protein WJ0W_001375 [Paenibacillus melissococcoides]|uniref:Thioredoxin domain-containing protein n=1 Tax=Paenibacillus melissococcoides TaxID=2912268 RepID=A0ABM9FY43_9BACL|nr:MULTISPECIES: hypothetical protein [Paenibacillus]MEB9895728.1 hypothetical protein [Bacillus cereus]CAH8244137.1 hypothetical protein WJ0W_001375 [Paenibacillus melissococcoides]CAH8703794.1 hypothetical protein HTL2_000288 [Paenibacillus melissococcoides]CAH8706347.1 hypothetical protein WDD9_001250 [Paenibacillus melissococcoides]GIO82993.1 hypothetical protein J6TS7_66030 [Paenibacillus dendritiformis]
MQSKLDRIFRAKAGDSDEFMKNYSVGDLFPSEPIVLGGEERSLFCFISLHCLDCVDLLPHLKKLSEVFSGEFILFTDASHEENLEIAAHFGYKFKLISCTKEDFTMKYRIYLGLAEQSFFKGFTRISGL